MGPAEKHAKKQLFWLCTFVKERIVCAAGWQKHQKNQNYSYHHVRTLHTAIWCWRVVLQWTINIETMKGIFDAKTLERERRTTIFWESWEKKWWQLVMPHQSSSDDTRYWISLKLVKHLKTLKFEPRKRRLQHWHACHRLRVVAKLCIWFECAVVVYVSGGEIEANDFFIASIIEEVYIQRIIKIRPFFAGQQQLL